MHITWTLDYRHLRVGRTYRVARAFRDHEGAEHGVGAGWLYLGHNYFAKEDGLTLYVARPAGTIAWVRLQCTDDEQGPIDAALAEHLVEGEVALDHDAFARELAASIGSDNLLKRQLALELVARIPSPPPVVAAALIDRLRAPIAAEAVLLLMALYNVAPDAAPHRGAIEALSAHLTGDDARIAGALLAKLS